MNPRISQRRRRFTFKTIFSATYTTFGLWAIGLFIAWDPYWFIVSTSGRVIALILLIFVLASHFNKD